MKKKSIITMVAALALVGAIGVGSTLAYFTDNDAATNVVTMGHVDIDLTEKSGDKITDAGLTFDQIVPGDVLSKEPIITVGSNSEDCYLRAKVEVEGLDDTHVADLFKDNNIDIQNGWVLSTDGYYYYQSVVKAEDEISLFKNVTIPTAWGNEVADAEFTIAIAAEAIQADHFTPATTSTGEINGWNGVTAETYTAPVVEETPAETPDAE